MRYLLILCLAMIMSCGTGENNNNAAENPGTGPLELEEVDLAAVREDVAALQLDHQKIAFLRTIMTEDQLVRKAETDALEQYGYDSPEHRATKTEIMNTDALNVAKINAFTDAFGPPDQNSVGRMQTEATWYAVHHSPDVETRQRHFELMRDAWKDGLLSGGMYTMYLQRWCEMETGDRVLMEGGYTNEEEIAALYEKLGIE